MKECIGFIIFILVLIIGMYIGAVNKESQYEKYIESLIEYETERCEIRIAHILNQLDIEFGALSKWNTSDGEIVVFPRRVKRKVGGYQHENTDTP